MKKIFKRTSLLLISALMSIAAAQAQKSPQDMDRFIDALMKKMTVEEKIGQLNLPVTGDITTGQAKSSDVAQKIEKGLVGGLFNLKGVDRILEVQKLAVEKSRLGIPLLFGMDVIHGYETIGLNVQEMPSALASMAAIRADFSIAAISQVQDNPNGMGKIRSWVELSHRQWYTDIRVAICKANCTATMKSWLA